MTSLPIKSSEIIEFALNPSAELISDSAREQNITEYTFATEFRADKTALRMNIAVREFQPRSKIEIPNSLRVYDVELEGGNDALRFSKITKKTLNTATQLAAK